MIDTIKLVLPQYMYAIVDHDKFTPNTLEMFSSDAWTKGKVLFSKQNPSIIDKNNGIYKPRISITRRPLKNLGYQNTLYLELSLPKLIFGNNFDELENADFEKVLQAIAIVLKDMGVIVRPSELPKAKVSTIHFGKNIILDDYSTPYTYINELKRIDINKINDCNQTDYRNGGLSYKFHSNLFEFTFYDKLKDLQRSKLSQKRAISNDDYCQLNLFDQFEKQDKKIKPFQVLRIEMRLNNQRKIKQTLKKYGFSENVSFQSLFDQELAKQLLLSYLETMLKQYLFAFASKSTLDRFQTLKSSNPQLKDAKLLELTSAQDIISNYGIAGLRNSISTTSWQRIKKSLKTLAVTNQKNYLQIIKSSLVNFETIHLVDFPQLMLNNDN